MKRLTKAQKAKNKAEYNRIRRVWNTTDKSIDYKTFKKIVKGISNSTGKSVKEAAQEFAHSRMYKTAEDIGRENILKGIKEEFRAEYDDIRRKMGKFSKGEHMSDRLSWSAKYQDWTFKSSSGKEYLISTSNSPKSVSIIEL